MKAATPDRRRMDPCVLFSHYVFSPLSFLKFFVLLNRSKMVALMYDLLRMIRSIADVLHDVGGSIDYI